MTLAALRYALFSLLCLTFTARASEEQSRLLLSIDVPEPGAVVGDPGGMAFLSGKALAIFGEFQPFDIMFVIDTSDSTSAPSGADVDNDGKTGQRGPSLLSVLGKILPLPNSDSGDSVLAAEVEAVRVLLDQLDPRTTRVGVIRFSGDNNVMTHDAYTQVPLTSEYRKVSRGLDEILDMGPQGYTNMATAVNLATVELLGTRSAYSERRPGARRIIIFLTDGRPTLPRLGWRTHNARMAISKAAKAAKAKIRIDTYAIGKDALKEPIVVVEMARVSGGTFTPVVQPKDLRAIFEDLSFAEIEKLEIINKTTKQPPSYQIQNPDGTFSALVPMREGKNTIEVYARSTDGTEARKHIQLKFLKNADLPALTPRQVAQRNRLLENRLLELQKRSLEIQIDRDEKIRRELELEIEREKAENRAEEMRKDLELELDE